MVKNQNNRTLTFFKLNNSHLYDLTLEQIKFLNAGGVNNI